MAIFSKMASPLAATTVLLAALSGVDAFWRMDCHSRTGLARIDPLVDYGVVSDHVHAIHGGNNFGFTTEYDDLMASECTSCAAKEDKSAYWTPSLHFVHSDGTVEIVNQRGGMLAYYLLYGDDIKAFKPGFKMIAGNTNQRNFTGPVPDIPKSLWSGDMVTQFSLAQKAIGFNCLDYSGAAEASLYRHFLPDKQYIDANCKNGLRLELMFPSCWNGKDVDSDNHKDHVAYPNLVMTGDCPSGFETRVPSLFYETIWDAQDFVGKDGEFVLSNGDPTGYGYHGDFINGWEEEFLQQAVNTCTNPSGELSDCPLFTLQSQPQMAQCQIKLPSELKNENCKGPESALPGNVAIQSGPQLATHGSGSPAPTKSKPAYTPYTPIVPTLSYKSPEHAATDSYGGGISIANIEINGLASAASTTTSTPAVTSAEAYVAMTPAPSSVADGSSGHIIGTTTYTSDGAVWEVAILEVDITVTAVPSAAAKARRHVRQHRHIGDKHGLA